MTKNINIPYGSFAADFYFCGFLASQSAVYPVSFTLPCVLIVILSAALALWRWKFSQRKINIPFISLIFGVLWASHITEKHCYCQRLILTFWSLRY